MIINKKNYFKINLIVIAAFSILFILYIINFSKIKIDQNRNYESYMIQKSDAGFLIQIGGLNLGEYSFNPLKSIDAVINNNWISYMGSRIEKNLFNSGPCFFKAANNNVLKMFVVNSFDVNASSIKLVFNFNEKQANQIQSCKQSIRNLIEQVNKNIISIINTDIESIIYKQAQNDIASQTQNGIYDEKSVEFVLKQIEDTVNENIMLFAQDGEQTRKNLESQLSVINEKLDEINRDKNLGDLLLEKIKLEKKKYVDLKVYELRKIYTPETIEKNLILFPSVLFFVFLILSLMVINLIYFKRIKLKKIF